MRRPLLTGLICAALLAGCSDKSDEAPKPASQAARPEPAPLVIPEQPAVVTPKTISHYVQPTADSRRAEEQTIEQAVAGAVIARREAADKALIDAFVPTERRVFFRSGDSPVPAADAQAALREALKLVDPALSRYRRLSDQQLKKEVRLRFEIKHEGERIIFEAKGFGKNLRRQMSSAESTKRNGDRASFGFRFAVNTDATVDAEWTFDYAGALELKPKSLFAETFGCIFPIPIPAGKTVSAEVLADGAKRTFFSAPWNDGSSRLFTSLLLAHRQENGALVVRGSNSEIDVYSLNIENRRLLTEAQLLFAVLKERAFFPNLVQSVK